MKKIIAIITLTLFLIIGCAEKEIKIEAEETPTEQDEIEPAEPEKDLVFNEVECNEICAEKGADYYGDCAYDDLGLDAERVGTCSDSSRAEWACNEKQCGCYCMLPMPT